MKKILFLHSGAELYGADNILFYLLKLLHKKEYMPIVILPCDGPLVTKLQKLKIDVRIIEYPILRRKYFNLSGIIGYIYHYFVSSHKLIRIVKKEKIDIIHSNTIAVLEGILISKKCKKPLVYHVHEMIKNPKIVFKITSFLIGKFSTKIIVVSNAVKNHLLKSQYIQEDKVEVVYNGVDNTIFKSTEKPKDLLKEFNIPENAFIVGMIGRVNAIKGQDEFMKAIDILLKKHDNIYAFMLGGVFTGQEWRFEELKNNIQKNENNDRIKLVDFRCDAYKFHNLFDVYVLPSIQYDSLPTVVLEAMACGKPVVGYLCGGISEMIINGENGYLTDIGNYQKLAMDIDNLYNNQDVYKEISNNNILRQKEKFSLNSFIKKIENIYIKL